MPVAFAELCPLEPDGVAQMLIRDGATGEGVTSSDQARIQDLYTLMEGVEFIPHPNRPHGTGWRYYVDLIQPAGSFFRITFAGDVRCDRIEGDGGYSVERGSWHKCGQDLTAALGELYESLASAQ